MWCLGCIYKLAIVMCFEMFSVGMHVLRFGCIGNGCVGEGSFPLGAGWVHVRVVCLCRSQIHLSVCCIMKSLHISGGSHSWTCT